MRTRWLLRQGVLISFPYVPLKNRRERQVTHKGCFCPYGSSGLMVFWVRIVKGYLKRGLWWKETSENLGFLSHSHTLKINFPFQFWLSNITRSCHKRKKKGTPQINGQYRTPSFPIKYLCDKTKEWDVDRKANRLFQHLVKIRNISSFSQVTDQECITIKIFNFMVQVLWSASTP